MKKIFLFPGLGADERMFSRLAIAATFPGSIETINYPIPKKDETLESYSARLASNLPGTEPLIFIGVSFGGIIAQEIARHRIPEKVILISTISSKNQSPFYFSIARTLALHRMLPGSWLKQLILLAGILFTHKSQEEKKLFEGMVRDADAGFIRWGIDQVLRWRQEKPLFPVIHIHGSKDKVFPLRRIPADHVITGGEHFIIVQTPSAINHLLEKIING
jgi:pimeloyl-ACP methyl ester carboxylesterase